jgi:hypothetical protein
MYFIYSVLTSRVISVLAFNRASAFLYIGTMITRDSYCDYKIKIGIVVAL